MLDLIKNHTWDVWSALAGLLGGGAVASLLTITVVKGQNSSGSGSNVNQTRARSEGDIVGGNKTTSYGPGSSSEHRG